MNRLTDRDILEILQSYNIKINMLNNFRKIQTFILISLTFFSLITKITCNKNLPLIGILAVPETGVDKTSKNYVVNAKKKDFFFVFINRFR